MQEEGGQVLRRCGSARLSKKPNYPSAVGSTTSPMERRIVAPCQQACRSERLAQWHETTTARGISAAGDGGVPEELKSPRAPRKLITMPTATASKQLGDYGVSE